MVDMWQRQMRAVNGETPAWERNTVSLVEHIGNEGHFNQEGFAWAMYCQARRHVEEYQAEVGLNVPEWLLDKERLWRAKWLAASAKSNNIMADIVSQLQAKGASK